MKTTRPWKVTSYTEEGLKICSDCRIPQSKENYYNNPKKWDGIANICKSCNCKRGKLKDKIKERNRRRIKYLKYKEREMRTDRIYKDNRMKNDPEFKILRRTRDRHGHAVRAAKMNKTFRTTDLLGCTAMELKSYIETQFTTTMNWKNYGSYWNIDHKYPLSIVDWSDSEQVSKACHYTNLQPLLVRDNIRKGKKYEEITIN